MKKTVIVTFAILANVLVIFGLLYYFIYRPNQNIAVKNVSNPSQATNQNDVVSKTGVTSNSSNKTTSNKPITTKISTFADNALTCQEEGCFNVKLLSCSPAEFSKSTNDATVAGSAAMYYRIVGYSGGGCAVYVKYIRHPNPSLINASMTCIVDNNKNFFTTFNEQYLKIYQGTSTCKGELANVLNSK